MEAREKIVNTIGEISMLWDYQPPIDPKSSFTGNTFNSEEASKIINHLFDELRDDIWEYVSTHVREKYDLGMKGNKNKAIEYKELIEGFLGYKK
jgi:hypothetical protein